MTGDAGPQNFFVLICAANYDLLTEVEAGKNFRRLPSCAPQSGTKTVPTRSVGTRTLAVSVLGFLPYAPAPIRRLRRHLARAGGRYALPNLRTSPDARLIE